MTYKAKTLQQTFTEIAGLLVLMRVATLILGLYHEYRYNRKIKMETQEEFREVFTYENFKQHIVINDQQNEEIANMKEEIGNLKEEIQELKSIIQEIVQTNGKKVKDD